MPMKQLVSIMEDIGCLDVKTYIQSGNVVFRYKESHTSQLSGKISSTIKKQHGFEPDILLLEVADIKKAVKYAVTDQEARKAAYQEIIKDIQLSIVIMQKDIGLAREHRKRQEKSIAELIKQIMELNVQLERLELIDGIPNKTSRR